jgi:hypothetical protein
MMAVLSKKPDVITNEEFQEIVAGLKVKLSCGHMATLGHSFSNTVIIVSAGGGKITTKCHECGY